MLAAKFLKPRRSYLSAISILSFLGVCLGVMTLIVVLSVMRGFEAELHKKVLGFDPHLTLRNDGILYEHAFYGQRLNEDDRVGGWTPFVIGPVLAEVRGRISAPQIRGIDPETIQDVIPLKETLVAGEWFLGPEGILVGESWARRHQAWVGDTVLIHSPRNVEILRNPNEKPKTVYLPSSFQIIGIFSTGFYDYDFNFLLVPLSEAQRLYNLEDGVHGLAIRLNSMDDVTDVQTELHQTLDPIIRVDSWMDLNRTLFSAVAVERRVMTFILFFIMIVAAFGLSGTTLTVVIQKSREIGLLKALGADDGQIMRIFAFYGIIVGILGAIAGVVLGGGILQARHEFSRLLSQALGVEIFPAEVYHFSEIPAVWSWGLVGAIALAGIVLSGLVSLVPALVAARVDPARTLHYE
ncbi:MAG: ABC transporter permease [Verrucomicrobiota bacterium]